MDKPSFNFHSLRPDDQDLQQSLYEAAIDDTLGEEERAVLESGKVSPMEGLPEGAQASTSQNPEQTLVQATDAPVKTDNVEATPGAETLSTPESEAGQAGSSTAETQPSDVSASRQLSPMMEEVVIDGCTYSVSKLNRNVEISHIIRRINVDKKRQKFGPCYAVQAFDGTHLPKALTSGDFEKLPEITMKRFKIQECHHYNNFFIVKIGGKKQEKTFITYGPEKMMADRRSLSEMATSKVARAQATLVEDNWTPSNVILIRSIALADGRIDDIITALSHPDFGYHQNRYLYLLNRLFDWNQPAINLINQLTTDPLFQQLMPRDSESFDFAAKWRIDHPLPHSPTKEIRTSLEQTSLKQRESAARLKTLGHVKTYSLPSTSQATQSTRMTLLESQVRPPAPSHGFPAPTSTGRELFDAEGYLNPAVMPPEGPGDDWINELAKWANCTEDHVVRASLTDQSRIETFKNRVRQAMHENLTDHKAKCQYFNSHSSRDHCVWALSTLLQKIQSGDENEKRGAHSIYESCIRDEIRGPSLRDTWNIQYAVPVENRFDALRNYDFELNVNYTTEMTDKERRLRTKQRGRTQAARVQRQNVLNRERHQDEEAQTRHHLEHPEEIEPEMKRQNYKACRDRLNKKVQELINGGRNVVARYILEHRYVSSYVMNQLTDRFDWLQDHQAAARAGLIQWAAFAVQHQIPKTIALAGYVKINTHMLSSPSLTNLGWVRDLTGDGDVESNPGPVMLTNHKDLVDAPTLDNILNNPSIKPSYPLQHYVHHRLTGRSSVEGRYNGDVAFLMAPNYTIQLPDSTTRQMVTLPTRETQIYPRSLPRSVEAGGQQMNLVFEWDWIFDPAGAPFPGQPVEYRPATPLEDEDEEGEGAGGGANDQIFLGGVEVDVLPRTPDGHIDRLLVQPEFYYENTRISVRRRGVLDPVEWMPLNQNQPIFEALWDLFDNAEVGAEAGVIGQDDLPQVGNFGHRLRSGCPVLFTRYDTYPNQAVKPINPSNLGESLLSTYDPHVTVLTHRPNVLLRGYKKTDLETITFRAFAGGYKDAEAGLNTLTGRVHLDVTALTCKLGLISAWWSLAPSGSHRRAGFEGQHQVLTPWVAMVGGAESFRQVIGGSINANENCGGYDAPRFPFPSSQAAVHTMGAIAFHITMSTVPPNESYLFIPKEWHDPRFMSTIALFILTLSPWPICNMGLWFRLRNGIDDEESICFYNWLGGLVHIPGETIFNIVWPRRDARLFRPQDHVGVYQEVIAFPPRAGPHQAGHTGPHHIYQVGGDYPGQAPERYSLIEFLMSWISAFNFEDLDRISTFLRRKGLLGNTWQNVFDVLPIWATRTSTMTVATDQPLGEPTPEDEAGMLADNERNLLTIHLFGNTVPRLNGDTVWAEYTPINFDGIIPYLQVEGMGLITADVAHGPFGSVVHGSLLHSYDSPTWLPMGQLAFRNIGVAIDLLYAHFKLNVDMFFNYRVLENYHHTYSHIVKDLFPDQDKRDPGGLYIADQILIHLTNGGHLLRGPSGQNLLRTVTIPRLWLSNIMSRNYAMSYPMYVPVKYPDVYFQHTATNNIVDWSPFQATYGIDANKGLIFPNCREFTTAGNVGPLVNADAIDFIPNVKDMILFSGEGQWNCRLLLIDGHATLQFIAATINVPNSLEEGFLPCLRPWTPDRTMSNPAQLSCHLWSNTIFFPTLLWNDQRTVVLQVTNPQHHRRVRTILNGQESLPWYVWYMADFVPVPLASDLTSEMSGRTKQALSLFEKFLEKPPDHSDPGVPTEAIAGKPSTDDAGNAQGAAVEANV